ncbi:hyaluronan-binding protein 2 [Brachyhypopomus gauderio]|uniref:hyaluronan-binding protein 2 n=1 Tax=Brachyhypopomus gauderio TaxID=698409 RepID=UPI0040419F5F
MKNQCCGLIIDSWSGGSYNSVQEEREGVGTFLHQAVGTPAEQAVSSAVGVMLPLILLLLGLQGLSQPAGAVEDIIVDIFGAIAEAIVDVFVDDAEETSVDEIDNTIDWLFDLFDLTDRCELYPCENNGTCVNAANGSFRCICPRPFKGKKCQDVEKVCNNVSCGRGECVRIMKEPFYECKCRAPYKPPSCKTPSACVPSPCLNGGTCVKGRLRSKFTCVCPQDYSGKFCEIGPDDCYEGDGASYRGFVSETVSGVECLHWNSYLIPYTDFEEEDDGIGPHNYCRNPDGESQPWCFIRYEDELQWDDCIVSRCPQPASPTLPAGENYTVSADESLLKNFSVCGIPQPTRTLGKIFGGRKAKPGAHPWQASFQIRPRGTTEHFRHNCGGILIDSCWVLTAAHCIHEENEMQVCLGGVDLKKEEKADQIVAVEEYFVHENYTDADEALYNDIALLRLRAVDGMCAKETRFVKTACLPESTFPDGMECSISGYGTTEHSDRGSTQLLDGKVMLIPQKLCMAAHVYGDVLDESMFCAGHMQGGVDSCSGDSGGPLVCNRNETYYVYGVVSWGDSCGKKNKPGLYARVSVFLDWINEKMRPT